MNRSRWRLLLQSATRGLAMVLILGSIALGGMAHAHEQGVGHPEYARPVLHHSPDPFVAESHKSSASRHCAGPSACHVLFLHQVWNDLPEPEGEDVSIVELSHAEAPAPVYSVFHPPRQK